MTTMYQPTKFIESNVLLAFQIDEHTGVEALKSLDDNTLRMIANLFSDANHHAQKVLRSRKQSFEKEM